MKRTDLFLAAVGIVLVTGILLSQNNSSKPEEKIGYAMDTQVRMVIYDKNKDENIINEAYNEMVRLDKLFSNFNENSQTSILNRKKECVVSDEFAEIIAKSKEISEKTNGAFDLTVYPLTKMWHYKNVYVPGDGEIVTAKQKIDYRNIVTDGNKVTLKNDAEIDVSSIAKGYIADRVLEFLSEKGIENALVDAGGNIKVMGSPSKNKNNGFVIGIQDPKKSTGIPLGQITIKDTSVVTSGIYERNFEKDGKFYHHIIDIKTGYPSESDVLSVSVITEESAVADAYATAIVVMGAKEGLKLIEETDGLECIIVRKDNKIMLSEGAKTFVLTNDEYTVAEE